MGRPRSCTCGECPKCKRADYMRERWARLTPEQRREQVSRRDPVLVLEQTKKRNAKRRRERPELEVKEVARREVRLAIERGHLVRPDQCERCGGEGYAYSDGRAQVHAHHGDYTKPLEVEWICNDCHDAEHRIAVAA